MRDSIIYYRNNPSILFWEAGNTVVTVEHLEQMIAIRKQWDPDGGRVMGARGNDDVALNTATTPIAEFYGVMIGQDPKTDALTSPQRHVRGYSANRRDRAPLIETEDFRDEGARRFWDDDSPPYFKAKKGPNDTWRQRSEFLYTSESFALAGIHRYWDYWQNRISNPDPAHSKWSGYASIYFSDSDADGRQDSSEVCRVSGKTDAVRLPKEIYFCHRVMQSDQPICTFSVIGVIAGATRQSGGARGNGQAPDARPAGHPGPARTQDSEDCLCGRQYRVCGTASQRQVPRRELEAGERLYLCIPRYRVRPWESEGRRRNAARTVAEQELTTAGPPAAIKLTPTVGPQGLQADGQDAAFIDFEVVDAKGQRCPTDDARVDFTISGQGYGAAAITAARSIHKTICI